MSTDTHVGRRATDKRGAAGGWHPALTAMAAGMAVAAAAGTVGLAGGGIHFGEPVDSRLPFASYGFAAAALGVAVVLPMSVAALTGWRRHPRAPQAAVLAGLMLVGWIAVQVAVIRSYSWMQPVCGVWGLTVVGLGWRARRR